MVDVDVVARRVLALSEALDRLAGVDPGPIVVDVVARAAVERWLQLPIDACIDLAYHVVAERGWTPPDHARGAFATLAARGLLDPELASRMGAAAAMRDLLVHDYAAVGLTRIQDALRDGLDDLRRFGAVVARLLEAHEG